MSFTKLRNVREDQIDTVLNGLTERDWDALETGYLDQIALDLSEWLDDLGIDRDRSDSVAVFWRIYQRMIHRVPEVAS